MAFSSILSSVGSCGARHFTRVCQCVAGSWGSFSPLDAQYLESLSPSHQREFGLEAGAPACLWRALGQHGDLGAEVGAIAA